MNNLKLSLNLFFCFCSLSAAFSQTAFVKGDIVLNNSDTLKGFLKQDVESNLLDKVVYSDNENGNPDKEYAANDIQSFHFDGGNLFESVHYTDANNLPAVCFAKYVMKGYYSLYSFRKKDRQYFIIRHEDTTYLLYDDVLLNSGILDTKGNYKNQFLFLSRNCSNLTDQIMQLNYNENELVKFTGKINDCVAPGDRSYTVAIKPKPKINFYVYAGGLPLGDKYEYTGRAMARLSAPSINKNLFFNAGISYTSNQRDEQVYHKKYPFLTNMFAASLSAQANFTTGIIQPYFELGVGYSLVKSKDLSKSDAEFESVSSFNMVAALGIEGYITKSLAIKADWRYDYFLHHPVIGVAYFF